MSKITAMTVTAKTSPRRSQAERSAATRDALLDATIACLVEDGYAKTTTSRVAERAGVSRGAHLHHFQTRQALVAAAMERLAERRGAELLAAAEDLPQGRERLVQGLDLLWASYANPLFQAALDLWSHARTDADLRERLVPVERRLDRQTLAITRQLFPAICRAARLRPADRDGGRRRSAASRCSTRCTPATGAIASSGSTAVRGWSSCLRARSEHHLKPSRHRGAVRDSQRSRERDLKRAGSTAASARTRPVDDVWLGARVGTACRGEREQIPTGRAEL